MQELVIIGTGQQAKVLEYNIKCQGKYRIAGYFDVDETKWGRTLRGSPIFEGYSDLDSAFLEKFTREKGIKCFAIALGNMKLRKVLFTFFNLQNWKSADIIHPNAIVSANAHLGDGVLVEAGCLITPNPWIGSNVVINTGTQVNHDNYIEDHVFLASGIVLSGGVTIGENTLVDDGVIVTLGKKIGKNCIIGAGSVVTKDIPDNVIAYGNPCKIVRDNKV